MYQNTRSASANASRAIGHREFSRVIRCRNPLIALGAEPKISSRPRRGTPLIRGSAFAMRKTQESPQVRVNEPRSRVSVRVRDLLVYRELLVNLVRKELKVKYKNSFLGFAWSMLNPALYLVIFYIVFTQLPRDEHPVLPDLSRVGVCSRGTCGRHHSAAVGRVAARQREPRDEGVLPARDPAAVDDRREPDPLLLPVRRAARARWSCSGTPPAPEALHPRAGRARRRAASCSSVSV